MEEDVEEWQWRGFTIPVILSLMMGKHTFIVALRMSDRHNKWVNSGVEFSRLDCEPLCIRTSSWATDAQ